MAPIQEVSPSTDRDLPTSTANSTTAAGDDIAAMCQELSQGLTMLTAKTTEDDHGGFEQKAFSPGHFSPPAALAGDSSTVASFSAFGLSFLTAFLFLKLIFFYYRQVDINKQ